MKKVFILFTVLLCACGGSLTDEQRREMKKAREQQAIVKVSDAEIVDAAFAKGREVMKQLKTNPDTSVVSQAQTVKIHWLAAGKANGLKMERQLIDAYLQSLLDGMPLQDNVQKIGTDSLLYTNPVVVTRADSSIEITGTWNVWISKRDLILAMGKH